MTLSATWISSSLGHSSVESRYPAFSKAALMLAGICGDLQCRPYYALLPPWPYQAEAEQPDAQHRQRRRLRNCRHPDDLNRRIDALRGCRGRERQVEMH